MIDKENLELDDELDEEVDTEESEELEPDTTNEDNSDDEFEYDEDGNIIIPDVVDDDVEDEDIDESQDETEDEDENEGSDKSEEVVEPDKKKDTESEDKKRIAELEKELKALKSQGKETLSKLGVEGDNVLEGFEKLAAEADDTTLEEYKKAKAEKERDNLAREMYQRSEFEKKMKADLAEIQANYPETKKYGSITEIENFARFGQLRDLGLSPKEAYAAVNSNSIRENVANAVKQKNLNNKGHLNSVVPKNSKDDSVTMTKSELAEWRDIFPNKTDKEIMALYKQSKN